MDLPAMARCPRGKKGAHQIAAIVPGDDEHDITLYCEHCGALRRAPATGELMVSRLDDLDAETIERIARR
jgi:hypothetical protein